MRERLFSAARKCAFTTGALAGVLGISFSAIGCTGVLSNDDPPGAGAQTSGGAGSGGSSGGAAGSTPAAPPPGYKAIHRLNISEYNATVADVLETTLQPATGSWSVYETNGFDNFAAVQHITGADYQRMFDAAGTLAADAFGRAAFKAKWVTCATSDDACVSDIAGKLGLRILRRPLTDGELTNYRAVYSAAQQQGEMHEGALQQVLRAMLASAEFLYRMEFDPTPSSAERHPLSAYELASRLSYWLWSSAPDEALLAAAGDGSLTQDATITAQVNRLLTDPTRSTRFVQNFYGQWLGARRLPSHPVALEVYPTWSAQLSSALTSEMYAYFTDFLQKDRSWLEFLTVDLNFVDATSAAYYGMPMPPSSNGLVSAVFSDQRIGFLGLGGFLALSSLDRRSSPTHRGRWILGNLLCGTIPPVPDNVPMLEESAPGTDLSKGNIGAILEKHRTDPLCAGCHRLFDPYGMTLEQFDGIGSFRNSYPDGSPINAQAELMDGTKVNGLSEMASALAQTPELTRCITDTLFSYGLGRSVGTADREALDAMHQAWKNDKDVPSIRRLVETLALDNNFRSRSGQAQ